MLEVSQRDINIMNHGPKGEVNSRAKRVTTQAYAFHYEDEKVSPHIKIESYRVILSEEYGGLLCNNKYNRSQMSKRCGYRHNNYKTLAAGKSSPIYLDMVYKFGVDMGVSIDYLINKKSIYPSLMNEFEKPLVEALGEMGDGYRLVAMEVWALYGIGALTRMLNIK